MKKVLSFILTFIVVFTAFSVNTKSVAYAEDAKSVSGVCNYDYSKRVLELVNEIRSKNGLSTLVMTKKLEDAAMLRAAELTVFLSHTRPNGQKYNTAFEWTVSSGENIAMGQETPEQVINDWMNSSGHKSNILEPSFNSIGVGCFEYDGGIYWVQNFCGESGDSYTPSGSVIKTFSVQLTSPENSTQQNSANDSQLPKAVSYNGVRYLLNSSDEYVSADAKKPTVKKLKRGKKAFTVTYSKVSGVTGYEVQYSTSKKFTKKATKKVAYKGNSKFTKTVKKLKDGKKYYVRVRTFTTKKVNGKTVKLYSSWSSAKTVTTKK
ncbi:MAG: CAP domain-containing protein [Eubacterium sp.]